MIIEAAKDSGNTKMIKRVRAAQETHPRPQELHPLSRSTGPLCATCREPGFLMDVFRGRKKTLHPSLTSLWASACAGCPFCCFLWKQLGIASVVLPQPSPVDLFPSYGRGTLFRQILERFSISSVNNGILTAHLQYSTESCQEYRVPIKEDTSSLESYRQIETWLEICDEGHEQCQVAVGNQALPSRLIYLDSSTDLPRDKSSGCFPRLISTSGMDLSTTKHITLSYRWPENFPDEAKSTQKTILKHMEGLAVSKLPLSFKELFQVATMLRIRHVWIDSLCIIQDDPEDWDREAALMSQIYQNAYLTVAISVPQDLPGKGLFCRADPPETLTQTFICPLEDGFSQEFLLMKSQEEKFQDSPLLLRGWCFQEREISRRIVHYTKNQVLWECRALQASESLPKGSTSLQRLISYGWDERMLDRGLGGGKVDEAWRRAIEDYSSRNLTKPTDKLPALAGLAAAICDRKLKTCRYVAGLWEDDILRGLSWIPRREDYDDKFFGRYRVYTAPTWSWASVNGPVAYDYKIDRKENSPKNACEYAFGYGGPDYVSKHAPQVLDICVHTSTSDPFGAVRYAALRCSARLLPAVLSRGRRGKSCLTGPSRCMTEKVSLETQSGEHIGDMHFDVPKEEYEGEGIISVFCICLGVLTSAPLPFFAGPALAVVPTLARDKEYRRVGIILDVKISDFESARIEEITII